MSITAVSTPLADRLRCVQMNRKKRKRLGKALRLNTDGNMCVKESALMNSLKTGNSLLLTK